MKSPSKKINSPSSGTNHCGSKPKRIAFGIAPLGFISVGIVPMGIVSIGVVPMGVVSLGVVAMGIINTSLVGMGLFSIGITTMGLKVWSPTNPPIEKSLNTQPSQETKNIYVYPSKSKALKEAKKLGCIGVHKMGDYWMPCSSHY